MQNIENKTFAFVSANYCACRASLPLDSRGGSPQGRYKPRPNFGVFGSSDSNIDFKELAGICEHFRLQNIEALRLTRKILENKNLG